MNKKLLSKVSGGWNNGAHDATVAFAGALEDFSNMTPEQRLEAIKSGKYQNQTFTNGNSLGTNTYSVKTTVGAPKLDITFGNLNAGNVTLTDQSEQTTGLSVSSKFIGEEVTR